MQKISTDLWDKILKELKNEVTGISFDTWISAMKPLYIENGNLSIEVPSEFHRGTLSSRYNDLIKNTIKYVVDEDLTPVFLVPEEAKQKSEEMTAGSKVVNDKTTGLNPRYTFENFVVGNSNRFAHAAALAVAEAPAKAYNPLFLYGGVGLGKTHLMHAIGHFILQQNPSQKVLYITSENFTNELINSIRDQGSEVNNNETFRNRYRNVDVLLIDDIQFIARKERTQEEFFHTFNAFYEANKQIIISSDKPPKDIEPLEERLRSRFEWGLIGDIQPPDYETRIAILRKKAQIDKLTIPDEINTFIASRVDSNIRELEGTLNKIVALAHLTNQPVSMEVAAKAVKDITSSRTKVITSSLIQQVVAKYYNLKIDDLKSSKRSSDIAYPRQIAMYLCREIANISLPQIGRDFGGRDHTTVIHACNKINTDLKSKPDLKNTIEELKKVIYN